MKVTIQPAPLKGEIKAIPSKSHAHRLLICRALAGEPIHLGWEKISEDIQATVRCLETLLTPSAEERILRVGESGSTYRFLFPIACALGFKCRFVLEGGLPARPMEPLFSVLKAHGAAIAGAGSEEVRLSGQLTGGDFSLPGNISSQYISGMMFALPLLPRDSILQIEGPLESKGYLDMTLSALREFGIHIIIEENRFLIPGNQKYRMREEAIPEGDWSNAAFWLCSAALTGETLICSGLNPHSMQGDKAVCEILKTIRKNETSVIDVSQVPDLVPALSAVAAATPGETRIINAGRLRIKESDRLRSVTAVLHSLGADISETADGLIIRGRKPLTGGTTDSWGDHRIVMMAAILSSVCTSPVTIENAQSVNKSYPSFFTDFESLGGQVTYD